MRKDVFDKASVGSVLAKHVYVGNLCPTDVGVLAKRKELVHRSRPCLSGENNYVICRTVEFDIRPFWGAFKIRRLRSKSAYHSISLAMMQYIYILNGRAALAAGFVVTKSLVRQWLFSREPIKQMVVGKLAISLGVTCSDLLARICWDQSMKTIPYWSSLTQVQSWS